MEWPQLIIYGYERVLEILDRTLDGMTQDDLNWRPHPECNSMGWLTWHLTRAVDYSIAAFTKEEQLWIRDRWYSLFGRAPEPSDIGFSLLGHSPEDAANFKSPNVDTFLNYHRAVLDWMERYISTLSSEDLNRELTYSWGYWERRRQIASASGELWYQPVPTLGMRLVNLLSECLQHAGQVAYLRGLLKGKQWQD